MESGVRGVVLPAMSSRAARGEAVSDLTERLRAYRGKISETTECYNGTREEAAAEIERLQARVAELTARINEAAEWMLNMARGHESLQAACDGDDAFMHSLEARAYRECYVRCAALSEPPTGQKDKK